MRRRWGWLIGSGTWSASGGQMANDLHTVNASQFRKTGLSDADTEVAFSYYAEASNGGSYDFIFYPRWEDSNNRLRVEMSAGQMVLRERVSGTWTALDTDTAADTDLDTWYNVRIVSDGADVTVWRGEQGAQMSEVLSPAAAAATMTIGFMRFVVHPISQ